MTWFGVVYVVLAVFGVIYKISEIGKPREPVTHREATISIIVTGLLFWGLFTIGVTN